MNNVFINKLRKQKDKKDGMKNKIKISEEDIFKFVFNPESLVTEKLNYLSQNQDHFAKEIEFCKGMNLVDDNVAESVAANVIQKINNQNIIELFPQDDVHLNEQGIKLAAASASAKQSKLQTSFSDAELNYLIRLVSTNSQLLLYFFTNDKGKKQFRIKFFPSENEYVINDTSIPIEILEESTIQKVVIQKI